MEAIAQNMAHKAMNATFEEKKAEAVERMKMLGIMGRTREEFRRSNKLNKSEAVRIGGRVYGALYWLDDKEREEVKAFEAEHNALVYHVIKCNTQDGVWDNYLYVSDSPEEWEYDREDIKLGYAFAYVNTHDYCSEFGTIGVREAGGGLVRTA